MNLEQLKLKASTLPYLPGVYIMKNADHDVIYVGKAKKLKNRVSQYFQDTASHSVKTRLMVSKVHHFDVIVCSSEFEALVLECSLIKQHKPKYNILLKDDKGFPYLRLNMKDDYPKITVASKLISDGAEYFGPYGSRSATKMVLETVIKALKLPNCSKKFPRDIGKGRPCLNYHMKYCQGWCQVDCSKDDYIERLQQAKQLLAGHYKTVSASIRKQMLQASDDLNFELAATLRDQLNAVESLSAKQLVATGKIAELDAIGFAQTETKACFAVLHFNDGKLVDKEFELLDTTEEPVETVSTLLKQYYLSRSYAPKKVLLPMKLADSTLFSQLLEQEHGVKTRFIVPERGDNARLIKLAQTNASEEAERVTDNESRTNKTLQLITKMLNIPGANRIESFDISNISGTDIVASMVVFQEGKPKRSAYKRFQIRDLTNQDDYASMEQVLKRRFMHLVNADKGFECSPDLLLIDGGSNHAKIAQRVLSELQLDIPTFGMVKDDRHRTRALITVEGEQIRIDANQIVFAFIGNIQEETHRFAINYHKKLRSKRLQYSALDHIDGIGPKRKQELLKAFKSLTAISQAAMIELEHVLPKQVALNVYEFFHKITK